MNGLFPAVVRSYDAEKRLCLVEIDGISTGAEDLLEAEILYPIGDKSEDTEIEIIEGDKVWVQFHGGDVRYPIITGYRTKNAGASVGKRRWHHNGDMELEADEKMDHKAKEITLTGKDKITLKVGSSTIVVEPDKITMNGTEIHLNP